MANQGIDMFTPNNPMSPYLCIKIDGKVYDIDVNFIRSLNIHRSTDVLGTFEFTIEDTFDLALEQKFMKLITEEVNDLSFQYGWAEGEKSPWYCGKIYDYTPAFHPNFALSITAKGYLDDKEREAHSRSFKGKKISDIVSDMCKAEGWKMVALDESDPLDEELTIVQGNVQTIDIIREKLEPEAMKGSKPFHFYLETTAEGANAYFVTVDKFSVVKKNYNFLINAGNYGSVISFEPAYNGSQVAVLAEEAGFFDIGTNEISVYGSEAKGGGATDLTIYGSTTPDRMKPLLQNKWFEKNFGCYNATLVIVGDPTIRPMEYINIMPMRPDGSIHHTGGTYLVKEVVDEIGGTYTTTLTLIKMSPNEDGGTMPFEEAVQLKNKE